jgi:GNAT superfamily N-acetyltransferase
VSDAELRLLPPQAAGDGAAVAALTRLVNDAYALGEVGLWLDGAARVVSEEMAGLIRDGEVAVATAGGRLAGCVRVQQLDERTGELGMLAATSDHRGTGIGRRLVAYAEELSAGRGLDTMQLELLVPTGWHTRLGYRVVRRGSLGDDYPHLVPLLATPCDLRIYHRPLGRPS